MCVIILYLDCINVYACFYFVSISSVHMCIFLLPVHVVSLGELQGNVSNYEFHGCLSAQKCLGASTEAHYVVVVDVVAGHSLVVVVVVGLLVVMIVMLN